MKNRSKFNILNSFLNKLGLPFFKVSLILVTAIGFVLLFLIHSFEKVRHLRFPTVKLLHLKTVFPKFPAIKITPPPLIGLKLPRLALPSLKIKFPQLSLSFALLLSTAIVASALFYTEVLQGLPDPRTLGNYPNKLTTQILDRNGKLLYKIYKDENRTLVKLSDLPDYVKNAFLTAEDKDFYHHGGFSIPGMVRALYKNVSQDKLEGGSTITQQLVKNTLLSNEKTIVRKLKEIILSYQVEKIFTKDQIFEMYLNQVGFGGPAYGIQEAANQYFNVDAKDLNLAQAAFLAAMPQAPSEYSPFGGNIELSLSREQMVLRQMAKNGFINQTQLDQALAYQLKFSSGKTSIKAPHFVMYVKDILTQALGENAVEHGGLIVRTTLDLNLQDEAQKIVTNEVSKLKPYHASNGAALITDPKTGEILAMVGSTDYFDLNNDGQVNLTTSLRQPGSSIKPINYALAFEDGLRPSTLIDDKPISFNIAGHGIWAPKNYDDRFHGVIPLRIALASSYNIPSVILLSKNGIDNFAALAAKLGISTWGDTSRYGLSMALGSLEVKMTDMATAYSTFANHGITTPLKSIISVTDPHGHNIFLASCPGQNLASTANNSNDVIATDQSCVQKQTISPLTAYYISDILSDPAARAPAFGYNSILNIKSAKVAVKTGTSNELRDNWAIGYTPDFLVATWVGNNDNEPMSHIASGITGASPIWADIFKKILADHPQPTSLPLPDNVVSVPICTLTGTLTCDGCPTHKEYFTKGTEPTTACDPKVIQTLLHPSPQPTSKKPQIL